VKRRWLKRLFIGLGVLVLMLALAIAWLGGTGSGLRFALGRAVVVLDDKLTYASAEGSLFGGMRLRDVRYHDPAIGDYRVAELEIAPRSRQLLGGELHLTGLTLRGVRVVLPPPTQTPPSEEPFELPAVVAPISLRIDALLIEDVDVRQHDDVPVIALDRVDGAATWRGPQFAIERLDVTAPEGEVRATAAIDTGADWAGDAGIDFRWQLPDQPQPLAGRVDLHGPQSQPSLTLALAQPSPVAVDLSWTQTLGAPQWQLSARSDAFDLAALMPDPPVGIVAFDVTGTGTTDTADLRGRIALDDYPVLVERIAGSWRDQQLVIDALALAEESGPGRLEGTAHVDLSGDTPTGEFQATWQAINPPLDAPFDRLAANGRIDASGSLDRLVADVQANATVDKQPVQLVLHAEGEPKGEIRFAPLTLTTGDGRLTADGSLRLEPAVSWNAKVQARDFNPGLLAPDWPGRVELDATMQGSFVDEALTARVDIARLGGTLKQRALGGRGRVDIAGGDRIDADLDLRLGSNTVDLNGRVGNDYDANVRFDITDFSVLLDDAEGAANGELTVSGRWPALAVAGRVEGSDIALADTRIGAFTLDVDATTNFTGTGELTLDATDLVLAGEPITRLHLEGNGTAADNRLALDAQTDRGTITLALAGRYDRDAASWSGRLDTLQLESPELPAPLALRESTTIVLSADRVEFERACLVAETSGLCMDGDWAANRGGDFGFELTRLPLAWLVAISGDDMLIADGELNGRGRFNLAADNSITGQAQIDGTPGRIRLAEGDAADRDLAVWTRLSTSLELDGQRQSVDADIELSPAGQLRAQLATHSTDAGATALSGSIDMALPDLSFIELLTPDVVQPVGELRGRLTVAGTTDAPRINGNIDLTGFRAELPALGLRLRDSTVALNAGSGNRIEVDGRIATAPDSTLILGGWFGLPVNGRIPMDVRVTGENVLVADIPAARVFISPDLVINADDDGLDITGEVTVPQARIMPEEIEGGAVAASPDVHVVDPQAQAELAAAEASALPVNATVTVRLGDRVDIEGYGLKGKLAGQLEVRERPARPTTGRGEIVVTGTYQAYGQDLDIERGRLLFTGTPLDNPLLDIRATRKVEAVTAGLTVTGNAQRPVLEVYSVPAMDQAEALSYLVLGRPLRQATSAEDQDLLGTAATAVSTAGGDLLAKSLGARLGLDDVGVGTSRDLGAGALTVGKYLSPRLYLGYGRSLFDGSQLVSLRYKLTERFELEAQSGTRENKAGINYRYER
jgi:translocation and assembly module TamB